MMMLPHSQVTNSNIQLHGIGISLKPGLLGSIQTAGYQAGLKRWYGPSCSALILRYTILGRSHYRFSEVGRIRTRAVAAHNWKK